MGNKKQNKRYFSIIQKKINKFSSYRSNPRNFNFDSISKALLTLFEMLSLEGYNDYRDIIIDQTGIVSQFFSSECWFFSPNKKN